MRVMAAAAASAAQAAGYRPRVGLAAPDWGLVAEALPVAGSRKLLLGLAAVPGDMLTLKPRLAIAATAARAGGK